MSNRRLSGPDAWNDAARKSKYGAYHWIAWVDRDGVKQADTYTYETVKQAMLDSGTQGQFRAFDRNGAMIVTWAIGAIMLRNAKWLANL